MALSQLITENVIQALLFPAPAPSYTLRSFPNELLWIPWDLEYSTCKPANCVPAILQRCHGARYLVLYLHSNGEDIGNAYPFGEALRMVLEVHVLLVEYPGYGICPGKCSEESLWRVAEAAFRFATEALRFPREDVIIMGRSLGAHVATRLARTYECNGLVLVAPFLSLQVAMGQYVGLGLAGMLVGDAFSNRENMRHVKAPLVVIHGQKDSLVPCAQGRELFELCPQERKVLVCPASMTHNCDLMGDPEFLIRPMLRFFSLPDYNFDELQVPAEAFDKSLCPWYHGLVEKTRADEPLPRAAGDQEPWPMLLAEGLGLLVDEVGEEAMEEVVEEILPESMGHLSTFAHPSFPGSSSWRKRGFALSPAKSMIPARTRVQEVVTSCGASPMVSPGFSFRLEEPPAATLAPLAAAKKQLPQTHRRTAAVSTGPWLHVANTGIAPVPVVAELGAAGGDALSTTNASASSRHSSPSAGDFPCDDGLDGPCEDEWSGDPDVAGIAFIGAASGDVDPDVAVTGRAASSSDAFDFDVRRDVSSASDAFDFDVGIARFLAEAKEEAGQAGICDERAVGSCQDEASLAFRSAKV